MKQGEVIKELDLLKLRIIQEGIESNESPLQKYKKWVDEVLLMKGKSCTFHEGKCFCSKIYYPQKWAELQTITKLVIDLVDDQFRNSHTYHKEKPLIQEMISEAIAMVLYIQEEIKIIKEK